MICDLEVMGKSNLNSYDEQYDHLEERIDPNSSTELQFIKYLKKHGLTLPDVAQYNVDDIYDKAKSAGALGGKLLGAGGGGFMLFLAPEDKQTDIINAIPECEYVPFKFENEGTKIIFKDDE